VLSGFLISWLSLKEIATLGRFRLGYFFVRRILRIWPLYFLMVFVALAAVLVQKANDQPLSTLPPLSYLFTFTLNFYISSQGAGFLFFLVFLWSISVEEQFYVLWGLLFRFFSKQLIPVCYLLLAGSVAFRYIFFPDSNMLYFHSLSVAGDFALGALLAKHTVDESPLFRRLSSSPKSVWVAGYIILAASLFFYASWFHSHLAVTVERLWFGLLFTFLLAEQTIALHPFLRYGKWAVASSLGVISYGLYCYHGLALTLSSRIPGDVFAAPLARLLFPVVLFLFTTFAAMASYRLFEKPFLALKHRYYPAS